MNHYPHHIGDFNNATRHLTRVERSLYRDLMDLYYDSEQPLPGDDFDRLAKRVLALSDDEKQALRSVLAEFFRLVDGVYRNGRCDAEIAKYHNLIDIASRAGKASAASRLNRKITRVQRSFDSRSTNQNQNQNHKPEPSKSSARVRGAQKLGVEDLIAEGVDQQAAIDWLAVRKEKRAPLTRTALEGVRAECVKAKITLAEGVAICARRSWQGFNASWDWRDAAPQKSLLELYDEEQAGRRP